jgi:AcrR family transcriptional regulator
VSFRLDKQYSRNYNVSEHSLMLYGSDMSQAKLATGLRRQQIVDASRRIIARNGMEALTIREIAKEVGISEGNIYRHFTSKKDLLMLLIDDIEKTLLAAIDKAIAEKKRPLAMLENVLKAHLSYVEQRRGLSLIVISETLRLPDKDLRRRMFDGVQHYLARIEQILAKGVELGQVRQDIDLSTAALNFFALIHTTVTLWALSNSGFALAKRNKVLWNSYLTSINTTSFYSN